MKIAMISCAILACLSLPVFAAQQTSPRTVSVTPRLLVLTAEVTPDTLPNVINWAATVPPYSSLAVPLLDNGGTGPYGQRVEIQTSAGIGGGSFDAADAQAMNLCLANLPGPAYHCAVIARVSLKS